MTIVTAANDYYLYNAAKAENKSMNNTVRLKAGLFLITPIHNVSISNTF